MNRRRVIGTLFGILAAGAVAPAAPAMQPSMKSTLDTTYGKLPARLCLKVDAAQLKQLRDGSRRVVLDVRNHVAIARYSPTFSVRLAGEGKSAAQPRLFGMIADRPADTGSGAAPQHFAFDLSAELAGRPDAPQVCVDVDVDHDGDDAKSLASTGVTIGVRIESS